MRLLLMIPALAVVALTGCGLTDDGPQTTQTRDVAGFTKVDNDGSVDVRLHVADGPQRVQVNAGKRVIGDVGTDVRDGTLKVTFDHHGWGGGNVEVEAWVPELAAVKTEGSGDIHADGVAADAFEAGSDGSGDVRVEGSAGRLTASAGGSGDARLGGLAAREAQVEAGGSGDVEVRASDRLAVHVDGSGDVRYHGDPRLTQDVDGSGDIDHAD